MSEPNNLALEYKAYCNDRWLKSDVAWDSFTDEELAALQSGNIIRRKEGEARSFIYYRLVPAHLAGALVPPSFKWIGNRQGE